MIKISRSFNNSTTRNSITIRLLSQVVSSKSNSNTSSNSSINSSSSSSSSISSKSTTSNKVIVVDGNSQLDYSTVGRYYQTLVHKGGQGALGLRDLKHLFEKCLQPDHLKYAIKAVEMYQRKGHDFSEEINSLFIRLCITARNPKAAVDICSVYKYRLGAWSTPASLGKLIESMSDTMKTDGTAEDLVGLVNLVTVSHAKGVPITKENFKLVLDHTIKQANLELHTKLIATAKEILSNDDINDLLKQFPAPIPTPVPSNDEKNNEEEQK